MRTVAVAAAVCRLLSVPLVVLLALAVLTGCAPLHTVPTSDRWLGIPFGGCPQALLEGRLVTHARAGVAVEHQETGVNVVRWPTGFHARDVGGVRQLVDGRGHVWAVEGQWLALGGGWSGGDEFFTVCGPFERGLDR